MGWTSYHATHYKNGRVDRKAECDAYFMEGLNKGYYDILKSSMKGSVYYAAVKPLKKYSEDINGNKIIVDIPLETQQVFGIVFLTQVDTKDYHNFSYKDMDETMGPCYYDCPKSILDLLSPTNNEYANNWRAKCREQIAKKTNPNSLNKLPFNSIIQVTMPFDTIYFRKGDKVKLQKRKNYYTNRTVWMTISYSIKFSSQLMKQLEGHYEVIQR